MDFELVDEGELIVQKNGEKISVPAGSAILIPPGESKLVTGGKSRCCKRYFGFMGTVLSDNIGALNLNRVTVLHDFDDQEFERLYAELFRIFQQKKSEEIRKCCALSYQLLLLLSQYAAEQPMPPELQKAVEFIHCYFAGSLNFEMLCSVALCGRTKLQWQFKQHLHTSFGEYLLSVRMKCAAQMLENTRYPIKEIADQCGYNDPFYFTNVFRKYYGISPRKFRQSGGHRENPPQDQ